MKMYYKYKEQIHYIIFGGLTTLINIVIYYFMFEVLHVSNILSNIYAWIASVLFAYITNKLWVFENTNTTLYELLQEFIKFIAMRLLTGGMDLLIMYITVDVMDCNALLMKVVSNSIVIISNYIASKKIIFKK